jgi:cytochrome c-type biogenesis protein CcmH
MFLLAAVGLLGLTLLLLLRPWQRRGGELDATARELNARIYRDQLAELDRDLAAGTLAAADHAQARSELQRRLLQDTAPADTAPATAPHGRRTSLLLAVALPIAATGLYAWLGVPAAVLPQATQAAAGKHEATATEIEQMVAGLAARLEKNPADPKGWSMLARSYHAMGRLAEAEAAFGRIGETLHQDPVLLADYADTLASRADGNLEGRPLQLVMAALQLDPDNAMALSLAATAAYKRADMGQAARYWQHLLQLLPPGSDDAQWVTKALAEIGAPATLAADAAAPARSASGTATANAGAAVSGSVTLAPALRGAVLPTDTVFVFARAADGSRMPLAVQRARVADLPLQYRLDDSLAISPQARLSQAAEVRIEARVSRSGNATPAPGDLFGVSGPVKTGATQVALQIDQVHP